MLFWSSAFLALFVIWFSVWAAHARPEAGIVGLTLPQAIFWSTVNVAIAGAVDAWARYGPELFGRRFLLLQERNTKAETG